MANGTASVIARLSDDVQEAERELLRVIEEADPPEGGWTPRRLQECAQNGWSASVLSIAFWSLVRQGELQVDDASVVTRPAG